MASDRIHHNPMPVYRGVTLIPGHWPASPAMVRYPSYDMLDGAPMNTRACRALGRILGTCLLSSSVNLAWGAGLPPPVGRVILSIGGNISETNAGDRAEFDRSMLEALGMHGLTTSTPWTRGPQHFEGVLMSDLLRRVGASGKSVLAAALNDYMVEIPMEHFERYPVLLALKHNGEFMRIREKGPLWLIYPRDDYQELGARSMNRFWIWQLEQLTVQ
jgi:hypothetical protein